MALVCPDCGSPMERKVGKYGLFYGCIRWPECDCVYGAHQDTGEPLGTPAERKVRTLRIMAHNAFDTLWKGPKAPMNRNKAYKWMAEAMGIKRKDAHIGAFTAEQCTLLVDEVDSLIRARVNM